MNRRESQYKKIYTLPELRACSRIKLSLQERHRGKMLGNCRMSLLARMHAHPRVYLGPVPMLHCFGTRNSSYGIHSRSSLKGTCKPLDIDGCEIPTSMLETDHVCQQHPETTHERNPYNRVLPFASNPMTISHANACAKFITNETTFKHKSQTFAKTACGLISPTIHSLMHPTRTRRSHCDVM